jgi:hypothetical protein
MIFLNYQQDKIANYTNLLKIIGSLSNLFSDSTCPYLSYRVSENLFCRAFEAKNLSRSDVSVDASKTINNINFGIGIKTFLEQRGNTMQKVAEFNRDKKRYQENSANEIIKTIANLRNERLSITKKIYNLDHLVYHCITRNVGAMKLYEIPMNQIQEDSIKNIKRKDNVIRFTDGLEEYSFNISKSTLYERFNTPQDAITFSVDILLDPFTELEKLFIYIGDQKLLFQPIQKEKKHIFLPLYSPRLKGEVPQQSQLNQWNAGGRSRDFDEVYISIPAWIHENFPDFFPPRNVSFDLELPNRNIMSAKVCQDQGKALMSNPNKALGKWLLRDILNLEKGELLTRDKLDRIGLDSVVIYKESEQKYSINFTKIGSFENFMKKVNDNNL